MKRHDFNRLAAEELQLLLDLEAESREHPIDPDALGLWHILHRRLIDLLKAQRERDIISWRTAIVFQALAALANLGVLVYLWRH